MLSETGLYLVRGAHTRTHAHAASQAGGVTCVIAQLLTDKSIS